MALIDIEYGSIASSETMNKNFMYLDDKISETSDSILTTISSILSNIATINNRLNDITDSINNSIETLTTSLENYRAKTKILVNKTSLAPNWDNCISIEIQKNVSYTAPSNGYILLNSVTTSAGNVKINNKTIVFKTIGSSYDNGAQLIALPVLNGDVIVSEVSIQNAYFLPTKEITIEEF